MIWTTKEINQVIRLRKAGCTAPELAAMLGIPESRAKGYISGLVARGKIPHMGELPAPRYFPESVDRKTPDAFRFKCPHCGCIFATCPNCHRLCCTDGDER